MVRGRSRLRGTEPAPHSEDLQHRALALLGRGHFENRANRIRDSPLFSDDLPHVVVSDLKLENDRCFADDLVHANVVWAIDQTLRDVLNQLFHQSLPALPIRPRAASALSTPARAPPVRAAWWPRRSGRWW